MEPISRRRRRVALVSAVAVAAVGLVAYLVMGGSPDRVAAVGQVTVTTVASGPVIVPSTASGRQSSAASPSPRAKPAATTAAARPSATGTVRTASAAAPLAGRIRPGVGYPGVATAYDAGNGDGACLYGPSADLMIAAMNYTDYESSKACGAYVLVRTADGASLTVRITNECPAPCAPGQLDLSTQAFAKLAPLSRGRIPITWSLLSPSTSGTISIRYKAGSSRYWCGIQVIGHRNPVALLEVRTGGGWLQLPRTDYNYFLSAQGNGCGGVIRITDIYGERVVVDGIALRPDVLQPTRVQFAQH